MNTNRTTGEFYNLSKSDREELLYLTRIDARCEECGEQLHEDHLMVDDLGVCSKECQTALTEFFKNENA